MFKSWRQTWRKWSRFQRFSAVCLLVTTPLAFAQAVQIGGQGITWAREKIYGLEPLELPLREIHSGVLAEVEYNLDCLKSFDRLRQGDVGFQLCKPKRRYIDSWFANVATLTSRDYYSSSEATQSDWLRVLEYYEKLEGVASKDEFVALERSSEITLRDALFLTGYVRFYYKNYFEAPMPKGCGFRDSTPICAQNEERLFGEFPVWKEQIESWNDMPARYTVDEGKRVDWYVDWLSLAD